MELRGRAVPPWPIPPARTPLEIEASLLESDVQVLFGAEEFAGDEPVNGPQFQWATHTEFPSVVRLFELNCCSIPLTAAGRWRHFCSACKSSGQSRLGDAERQSRRSPRRWTVRSCTSFRLLRGGVISEVSEGSVRFSPDGRLPLLPSLVRTAARDERCIGVDEGCVLSTTGSAEEEHTS